jgi:hypothetical protein
VAIKGKSRKRARSRGPALPPKPAVGARKTPLPMRRDVKRALVIGLAVLALLGGLRVWQNDARHDALDAYRHKLFPAEQPWFKHLQQDDPSNFDTNIQAFTQGRIGGSAIVALADLWEKDFRTAEDRVKRLHPPNKVAADAQVLIVLGLDSYVGLARLYNVAGQVKLLADAEKDPKQKTELNNKVQVIIQHASEWRTDRADKVFEAGAKKLNDLLLRYRVIQPQPSPTAQ